MQPTTGGQPTSTPTKWLTNSATTIEEIKKKPNTYKSNSAELDSVPSNGQRKPQSSRSQTPADRELHEWFEAEFWPIYPRHEGKAKAREAACRKATSAERRAFYIRRLKA